MSAQVSLLDSSTPLLSSPANMAEIELRRRLLGTTVSDMARYVSSIVPVHNDQQMRSLMYGTSKEKQKIPRHQSSRRPFSHSRFQKLGWTDPGRRDVGPTISAFSRLFSSELFVGKAVQEGNFQHPLHRSQAVLCLGQVSIPTQWTKGPRCHQFELMYRKDV